jgi:catechol 2,3-dioxygenase-like lactoylglutathione lyase family enzyme
MKIKSWVHTGLAVNDLDRSSTFYQRAFAYEVVFCERGITREIEDVTGIKGQVCDLAQLRNRYSDHVLELLQFRGFESDDHRVPQAPLRPGEAHVAFVVDDLDRALSFVQSLGASPLGKIASFPEGRAVYCREPGGTFFELEEETDRDQQ